MAAKTNKPTPAVRENVARVANSLDPKPRPQCVGKRPAKPVGRRPKRERRAAQ